MLALILLFPLALVLIIGAYVNQPEEEEHPAIYFEEETLEEMLKYVETDEEVPVQQQVDLSAYPTREEVMYMIECLKNL